MAEDESGDPSFRAVLKAAGMTPGVWLGIAGYAVLVAASLLPWYNISAQIPAVARYHDMTTLIGFDGINGLYVHPDLASAIGFGGRSVGFPFAVFFILGAILKIRKIIRSNEHKMRAATLTRSSIAILVPLAITFAAIYSIPSFLPASAPPQAQLLAHAVASQPFGGSTAFDLPNPDNPLTNATGTLQWGFGPAIYLMVAAALLMNVGSQLEMRTYRQATHELELQAAEERATAASEPPKP